MLNLDWQNIVNQFEQALRNLATQKSAHTQPGQFQAAMDSTSA
jgi:hypothetical protein